MRAISITAILIPFAAYLLGSIPFGLLLAKLFGAADVRKSGSGNIGATNVTRVAGPLAGILTLVFDTSKGAAAVWLAGRFTGESAMWMTMAACAVLLGHCFPIWLKFKGGKGVATALGIFLALCPLAAVAALLPFPLCVAYWCCVSLGSVAAASAVPVLICFLWVARRASPVLVCVVGVACVLVRNFQHGGRV